MTNIDDYIQRLLEANPLREPVLRSAIHSLQLLPGSRGLDVGCGLGLQSLLLAEAVGPQGHVTGIDIVPEFLEFGEKLATKAKLSERVTFREGDMNGLPFPENSFDWAWSADCIGYPAGELIPILQELMRVVKPGGFVTILAWSSQQVLPGYTLLEARLNGTCSSYIPFLSGKSPKLNFQRSLSGFRQAGLDELKAQTFVGDVQAPLGRDERAALTSLFEMLWGLRQPNVSDDDWKEYQSLCKPGSESCILEVPDYYAFFTYTMFQGRVPLQ